MLRRLCCSTSEVRSQSSALTCFYSICGEVLLTVCSQAAEWQQRRFIHLLSSLRIFAGIGLTGTKLGCGEGGCGACTVMVSSWEQKQLQHRAINACLCPLYAVEGMHVVTVEGVLHWSPARSPTGRKHALICLEGGAQSCRCK